MLFIKHNKGSRCGAMGEVLGSDLKISEYKLQLCYYVHFWTNTREKDIEP